MTSRPVKIVNDLGLHLRAAGALVQLASKFKSEIWLVKEGARANGKSTMSVLSLAASKGTQLTLECKGEDESQAADALAGLIANGFDA
jgi:phosphocarrier protein HPr